MSMKHRLQELRAAVPADVLDRATAEYSDLLLTMCLCMKFNGLSRKAFVACAKAMKLRMREPFTLYRLDQIIKAGDPVGFFLQLRREVNTENARVGIKPDHFV